MPENVNITEPTLIIRVNKLYREGISPSESYEITRGVWKVGDRRSSVENVFSVYHGEVKEIYKVKTWHPALTTNYEVRTEKGITLNGEISMKGRWEFIGEVAAPSVRSKYLNMSVASLFERGSANPVKYVNC